jgi:hypothetical protein
MNYDTISESNNVLSLRTVHRRGTTRVMFERKSLPSRERPVGRFRPTKGLSKQNLDGFSVAMERRIRLTSSHDNSRVDE